MAQASTAYRRTHPAGEAPPGLSNQTTPSALKAAKKVALLTAPEQTPALHLADINQPTEKAVSSELDLDNPHNSWSVKEGQKQTDIFDRS